MERNLQHKKGLQMQFYTIESQSMDGEKALHYQQLSPNVALIEVYEGSHTSDKHCFKFKAMQ